MSLNIQIQHLFEILSWMSCVYFWNKFIWMKFILDDLMNEFFEVIDLIYFEICHSLIYSSNYFHQSWNSTCLTDGVKKKFLLPTWDFILACMGCLFDGIVIVVMGTFGIWFAKFLKKSFLRLLEFDMRRLENFRKFLLKNYTNSWLGPDLVEPFQCLKWVKIKRKTIVNHRCE